MGFRQVLLAAVGIMSQPILPHKDMWKPRFVERFLDGLRHSMWLWFIGEWQLRHGVSSPTSYDGHMAGQLLIQALCRCTHAPYNSKVHPESLL